MTIPTRIALELVPQGGERHLPAGIDPSVLLVPLGAFSKPEFTTRTTVSAPSRTIDTSWTKGRPSGPSPEITRPSPGVTRVTGTGTSRSMASKRQVTTSPAVAVRSA